LHFLKAQETGSWDSFEDDFSGDLLNVLSRKGTHGVEVVAALAFETLK
jgi:hypothetical protein